MFRWVGRWGWWGTLLMIVFEFDGYVCGWYAFQDVQWEGLGLFK